MTSRIKRLVASTIDRIKRLVVLTIGRIKQLVALTIGRIKRKTVLPFAKSTSENFDSESQNLQARTLTLTRKTYKREL